MSSVGFQRFWGFISQMHVLKVKVSDVGFKLLVLQGNVLGFEFPPDGGTLSQGWGLWQDCVSAFSTHFSVGHFFSHLSHVQQSLG